jgi:signal transduction histidine kinase
VAGIPSRPDAGPLDAACSIADNFRQGGRCSLETPDVETLRAVLDRTHREVADLRASRSRLVLAEDDDRRRIERALHDGVQQHLIALAVNLQLTRTLVDTDPVEAQALLEQMGRDVQRALDETVELAQRIHAPLLHARGLGPALRAAAAAAGTSVSVDVSGDDGCPPEVASTIYLCCLDVVRRGNATVTVRELDTALVCDIAADDVWPEAGIDRFRDRVEALGGRLTVESGADGTRVSAALPLSR